MAKPPGMNYRPRGVWEKIRVLHHRSGDVGCLESAHMSVFGCSRALRPVLGGAPWWSTPAPPLFPEPPWSLLSHLSFAFLCWSHVRCRCWTNSCSTGIKRRLSLFH